MAVTTRTNLATNPRAASATGFTAVAGTGGTAALSNQASGGPTSPSVPTFNRVTWSVATTAPSGGCSYTQTGLSANTMMAHMVWVRSSKAQTVALTVQYQTSGAVNDGAAVTGSSVALAANTWTAVIVTAISGPSTAQAVLTAAATSAGVNWAANDTLDLTAELMEAPPVARTNLALNPSFEAASGTVTVRTNYCNNPTPSSMTGWSPASGSGEADTLSYVSTAGDAANGGTGSVRSTVNTAKTTGESGIYTNATNASGNSGETITVTLWVRTSISTWVNLRASCINSVSATVGVTTSAAVSVPANTWTQLTATVTSTGTYAFVQPFALMGSTFILPVGGTIDVCQCLVEKAPARAAYFDGSTAAAGDYTYAWTGAAGGSNSIQSGLVITGAAPSNTVAYQSTAWNNSRGHSMRITPTSQTVNDSFAAPGGDIGGMRLGMVAGNTYTASATVRLAVPLTGTIGTSNPALSVMLLYKSSGGSYVSAYGAASNVAGTARVSVTVSIPTGATEAFVRLYHGGYQGSGDVWWDDFLLEKSSTLGTYFDGATAQTSTTLYGWNGTPDSSASAAMTTPLTYFDGAFVNAAGVVYAWSGAVNASTSTATAYQPYITLVQGNSPSPNVQATWQDFDTQPGGDQINVWRTVDGVRRPVRGCRHRNVVGSDFVTDYEAALGRPISYDIEILSGVCAGVVVATATTTITSSVAGWISDPVAPASAIPVYGDVGPNGEPGLDVDALAQFEYKSTITKLTVAGTSEPVALVGQRQAMAGVDVNVSTLATTQANALRVLLKQAATILFRPVLGWASGLPGLAYMVSPSIIEKSINERMGGQIVEWKVKGDIVAPPAAQVVVPTVTFGTVSAEYATFGAFDAAHQGQTLLQVVQNP